MMITAYQKSIRLSGRALRCHESSLIILQILYEAANVQSCVADGSRSTPTALGVMVRLFKVLDGLLVPLWGVLAGDQRPRWAVIE